MGFGVPAAIGAKIANPDKEVVLFVGDGGFQPVVQLVRGTGTVIFGVLCPILWLGLGDKFAEDIHVDALCDIVLTGMYPITLGILTVKLFISMRDEMLLYVVLESFFGSVHGQAS